MKNNFQHEKNKGFIRLVDFGDAISSRTKSVSPKLTTGFTLVEMLVAVSIFTISILGIMSVLASGISNTNYAKQKMVASYLAQEGIEYLRNMRDNYVLYPTNGDWNDFKSDLAPCNSVGECGFNTALYAFPIVPNFLKTCTSDPNICKVYIDNGNYNTNSSGTDSGFTRKIWAIPSADEVKIFSEVSWNQGSGNRKVTFSESLFNWR